MYIFILIDHLAVRVTVMISAVIYVFLDRRWFLNHYPMKLFVICHFDIFTFSIHIQCVSYYFL